MKKALQKLPILDIYLASFLALKGHYPEFEREGSRVIFVFPSNDTIYQLIKQYNENFSVSILDYVSILRRLRSQMLGMKSC